MNLFKRLHGRRTPAGREVLILKWLPRITLIGTCAPIALAVIVRVLPPQPGINPAKHVMSVDIFAIATTLTFWTAMFTVAIACVVVHIMKGPAYVADAYPLQHADRPIADETKRGEPERDRDVR